MQYLLGPSLGRLGGGAASEAFLRAGYPRPVYLIFAQLLVAVGMAILVGHCNHVERLRSRVESAWSHRLKLDYENQLSSSAFKFCSRMLLSSCALDVNLRRYVLVVAPNTAGVFTSTTLVGRDWWIALATPSHTSLTSVLEINGIL
jgi:hypothetical protein